MNRLFVQFDSKIESIQNKIIRYGNTSVWIVPQEAWTRRKEDQNGKKKKEKENM